MTWSARLGAGATELGLLVDQVVTEIGSGMDGASAQVDQGLSDLAVSVLVVEHCDRLTRFGFGHLAASLAACGRWVVVCDDAETADDLVRDLTEVLTSLCARRSGCRLASGRAATAVVVATGGDQP